MLHRCFFPISMVALCGFVLLLGGMGALAVLLLKERACSRRLAAQVARHRAAQHEAEASARASGALVSALDGFAMVCVTALDGAIIDVNDALCQASGWRREELIGRNPRVLSSGRHDALFWITVWRALLHGKRWTGEVCNRAKDGRLYWTQCVIAPLTDAQGRVERHVCIASDITEARRVQDGRQAHAERYDLAIEGGNDGLWDWMDVQSAQAWWSPRFYRLLGYEPGEIPATLSTVEAMVHPDDRRAVRHATRLALREGRPFEVECRLRTKPGAYRWFRARGKVYVDELGETTRMAGCIQDVHEHKEALAKISEQGQQSAAIFSLSPDGFVAFDAQGRVSYISPAFADLTGLPGRFAPGMAEADFSARLFAQVATHPAVDSLADVRRLMRHDEQRQGGPGGTGPTRVVLQMRPPGRRALELRLSRAEGGAVSQVLCLRDVTHEIEVDQMKSAFLSVAAHELRTPMASIYGFTELLLTRELPPDRQRDLLGRIHRHSEGMTRIVNELLDLARIEARQGKDFSFTACDLAGLVADLIRDFRLPDGRHAPLVSWPALPVKVWVDRQKLRQAVLNVLSNAYKYSPDGGDVELRLLTRVEGGREQAGLQIQDHGIGLSPGQLARVGERFWRADRSGAIPGTGLGMTIVKEIMDVLGGTLALSSELGRGTTVTLWLSCVESDDRRKSAQSRDAQLLQVVTEFPTN